MITKQKTKATCFISYLNVMIDFGVYWLRLTLGSILLRSNRRSPSFVICERFLCLVRSCVTVLKPQTYRKLEKHRGLLTYTFSKRSFCSQNWIIFENLKIKWINTHHSVSMFTAPTANEVKSFNITEPTRVR